MQDDSFFWEGLNHHQLLFQQCSDCDALRHPPGPMCPLCQSLHWRAKPVSGAGTVRAWLESKHPTQPDANPRIVALVQLPEGIRIVSNLQGIELADIYDGLPVKVFFEKFGDTTLHQFHPVGA